MIFKTGSALKPTDTEIRNSSWPVSSQCSFVNSVYTCISPIISSVVLEFHRYAQRHHDTSKNKVSGD